MCRSSPTGTVGTPAVRTSCASGVMFVRSASVIAWRTSGGGLSGIGCVGHVSSPGTSDRGTGTSVHGKDRLTGIAVEHEHQSHLRELHHRVARVVLPFRRSTRIGAGGLS